MPDETPPPPPSPPQPPEKPKYPTVETSPLLADYRKIIEELFQSTQHNLARRQNTGAERTFSSHISDEDYISVLLDRDLDLIRWGEHPLRDEALLIVAHRAILLYRAREIRKRVIEARRREIEKDLHDRAEKRSTEEIKAQADRDFIDMVDRASDNTTATVPPAKPHTPHIPAPIPKKHFTKKRSAKKKTSRR